MSWWNTGSLSVWLNWDPLQPPPVNQSEPQSKVLGCRLLPPLVCCEKKYLPRGGFPHEWPQIVQHTPMILRCMGTGTASNRPIVATWNGTRVEVALHIHDLWRNTWPDNYQQLRLRDSLLPFNLVSSWSFFYDSVNWLTESLGDQYLCLLFVDDHKSSWEIFWICC